MERTKWKKVQLKQIAKLSVKSICPSDTPETSFTLYSLPSFDANRIPEVLYGNQIESNKNEISGNVILVNKLNVRKRRIWNLKGIDHAICSSEFLPLTDFKANQDFLYWLLISDKYTQYFVDCSSGTSNSQKRIQPNDLLGCTVYLPPLPEQQKIAEILMAQDAVIALMQKQIELLQKQKKAFLQKMFPKKGCEYPEIRFSGFTGAWKQYHLGDLYIERNEKGNDSLPILSVSIHSGVSDGELDTEALGKIVRRSEDKSTYKHVFCGDLVFNMMRAWQGAIGVVKREGMVSPAYISAIPNEKVYPPFMNYLLRRKAAVDQINDLSYGVTDFRKRLYWKSFIRVSCQLPSLQEQKMITELFESLDNLINQHQRKLELEQQKKKALMQLLLTGKVRCV